MKHLFLLALPLCVVAAPSVLVLGSGGLIGHALVSALRHAKHPVTEVRNRLDVDLRFAPPPDGDYSFVFFLACEVGGSKFLLANASQTKITAYNEQMYSHVFPWLKQQRLPFLFASSMLASQPTAYGRVKKAGETLAATAGGKSVVFYNVYGFEPQTQKSHVLSDWVASCSTVGRVASFTDGLERRQFANSADIATGLVSLMQDYAQLPTRVELTTGVWTSLRDVAAHIQAIEPCNFTFSSVKSSLETGPEPTSPVIVQSDMRHRLRRMFSRYKVSSRRGAQPYISVVTVAQSHDRLTELVDTLETAHVDYEVVAVQATPAVAWLSADGSTGAIDEIPASQHLAWRRGDYFQRVKIVTLAGSTPTWRQSGFAGGVDVANGKFIMALDASAALPLAVAEQLAKRQLTPGHAYTASLLPAGEGCAELAPFAHFCQLAPAKACPLSTGVPARRLDVDAFLVASANDVRANTVPTPERFFDDGLCILPSLGGTSLAPAVVLKVPQTLLRLADAYQAAFNPLLPSALFRHHHVFTEFRDIHVESTFDPDYLRDFVGTRTAYEYDCGDWKRYRRFHLSRRVPCARHDALKRAGFSGPVLGELPVIDEEYFEWEALLTAVVNARSIERPFVVVELGSRYGTWLARGGNAYRTMRPGKPLRLLGVEADFTGFQWMGANMPANGFAAADVETVRGFVGATRGPVRFDGWEPGSPVSEMVESVTVPELLAKYTLVDIMHIDIQGAESLFLDQKVQDFLAARVLYVHFGTHGADLHVNLRKAFDKNGWTALADMDAGKVHATRFGDVRFDFDGLLTLANPRLVKR